MRQQSDDIRLLPERIVVLAGASAHIMLIDKTGSNTATANTATRRDIDFALLRVRLFYADGHCDTFTPETTGPDGNRYQGFTQMPLHFEELKASPDCQLAR